MSRTRKAPYLVAIAAALAAAAIYLGAVQPASGELARLSAERQQLQEELARMRAEIARLGNSEPPELPPASQMRQRLQSVALRIPQGGGYSLRADHPQPVQDAPGALLVRLSVTAETSYAEAVSLLSDLQAAPACAVENASLARVRGQPGRVKIAAIAAFAFRNDGTVQLAPPAGPGQPAAPAEPQEGGRR